MHSSSSIITSTIPSLMVNSLPVSGHVRTPSTTWTLTRTWWTARRKEGSDSREGVRLGGRVVKPREEAAWGGVRIRVCVGVGVVERRESLHCCCCVPHSSRIVLVIPKKGWTVIPMLQ